MNIVEREQMIERIGFLRGAIESIRLYAVSKDGRELVGVMQRPLKEVLEPYKEELKALAEKLDDGADKL